MIFAIEDDNPVVTAEARFIKEFDKIIKRDKGSIGDADGRKKQLAKRELAYIYWMVDFKSTYRQNYSNENDRSNRVADGIGLYEICPGWKPDSLIENAIKVYEQLVKTPSLSAVQNTIEALNTTVDLIKVVANQTRKDMEIAEADNWDLQLVQKGNQSITVDPVEKLVTRITALLKLSKELQLAIDKLANTEERVKQEFVKKQTMLGNSEKGLFEEEDAY